MNKTSIVLAPEFEKAVLDLGFEEFTEIQDKCIPLIQQGKDVIGLSHTGSGKTAAFGFPALEKVEPGKGIQLLVIVPTRELCHQIAKEFRKFTKYRPTTIIEIQGGLSINPQIENLKIADVVVGTPGRLLDHLMRRTFNTSLIRILVLDEADKMFEMGFIDDLRRIISKVPRNSQKLMFSATMPQGVQEIARHYMNNPERVKMPTYVDETKLLQYYYDIDRKDKFSLLVHAIRTEAKGLTLVFCGTRHYVDLVNKNLNKQGVRAMALHGGMTQSKRDHVMELFHQNKLDVLVASDVAARGLDIKNVNLVINYDLPKTSLEYVHRIGRTARAGQEGKVISLLSSEDHENFRRVLDDRSLLIQEMSVPEFERFQFVQGSRPAFRPRGRFGGGGYQRR